MEESMGPYYFSCPLKYLGMVPLDVHGGDASWREQVIDHHRRSEEKRYAPQGVGRIEKSETVHDDGYYRVGPVCIYPDERKERRQCSDLTVSESDR